MKISATTRLAGVVGNPARHSLSPIIHNTWIEAAGLDAVYLAFEPPAEGLARFVEGLRGGTVLGLNVTIPFKEQALAAADLASEAARRAGAANLLLFRPDGAIEADNTDGAGLIRAMGAAGQTGGKAVLLGAGGAARGAAIALLEAGFAEVALVNRTPARAREVAALDPRLSAHTWEEAPVLLAGAAALINATSLGMSGQPPLELSLDPLPASATVVDMVYRPLRTGLLVEAAQRGNRTISGLDMLIEQAVPSFRAIFGREPEGGVRGLCLEALGEPR
jgi:shikimate dehydrogenase